MINGVLSSPVDCSSLSENYFLISIKGENEGVTMAHFRKLPGITLTENGCP